MAEFKCYKCGEINEVDLSQIDITEEFINQGFEESAAEIEKLEASNKALELKLERTIKGLEDSKSGISKAISKTKDQSVEIQGEVAEELLQSNLEEAFPNDSFIPIKKGQRGADIKQVIFGNDEVPVVKRTFKPSDFKVEGNTIVISASKIYEDLDDVEKDQALPVLNIRHDKTRRSNRGLRALLQTQSSVLRDGNLKGNNIRLAYDRFN